MNYKKEYVVVLNGDEPQFCYGHTGRDAAAQSQIFSFEEAVELAKELNEKEPNYLYSVHRIMMISDEIPSFLGKDGER